MHGGVLNHPTPQGRTLGKFRLIARLGQGGMAEVFLAVVQGDVGFNKLVVVKLLKPELMEETEHRAMFLDEGRLAARLNHPNIVQTNEVQIVGEQYFIAMEYLDGQPLHRVLRRAAKGSPLPTGWHLHFLCEVLAALEYAHDLRDYDGTPLKVVHRDVTPHNVFVTYGGQVKLCDFGIAKTLTSSVETREGVLKGKVNYMAPEQVLLSRVDARADLFAVGVMLWESITGTRMWQGHTDIGVMQALSQGHVPCAHEMNPHVDPELDRICERALQPNPEHRYGSAAEFRRDLEGYLLARTERINPRRIGEWVAQLFVAERANLAAVIQQQLSGADGPVRELGPRAGSSESGPSSSAARAYSVHFPAGPPSQPPSRVASVTIPSTQIRAMKPNRSVAIAIGAGVATALFALVVLFAVAATRAEPGDVTAVESPPAPAAPNPAAATAPQPEQPATIEVRIRATPRDAKLLLDGRELDDNPFLGSFAKDGQDHILRIEAPGYETETRRLTFDRDVIIELGLQKKTAGRTGSTTSAPKAGVSKPKSDDFPDLSSPKQKSGGAAPIDTNDPWK
jgi:eukaryotic-like serine/threonine-protein kinase